MAFLDNIALAIESLRMNRMRAILTMLGIIIGIGSVIAINTVGTSLTGSVSESMSAFGASSITVSVKQKTSDDSDSSQKTSQDVKLKQFGSSTPSSKDLITDDMISQYQTTFKDEVKLVELKRSVGSGTIVSEVDSDDITANINGVSDNYVTGEDIKMLYGTFLSNKTDDDRKVCVVSDRFITDTLNTTPMDCIGKLVQLTVNNKPLNLYIKGVYEYENQTASTSSDDDVTTDIYIPLNTAKLLNGDSDGYSSITVKTNTDVDTTKFLTTTGNYFQTFYTNNDSFTCEATSLETVISTMTDMVNTISYAIAAIAAISLIVGGIGVMNIMLVSITERTKEIGTRKALGAPNSSIRLQFITESIVICVIGGIIGIILGLVLGVVLSNAIGFSAKPSVGAVALSFGFSILVGVIFGYAPANKAAKLDPIDALRYE